jgi:ribonuclease P protein component
LGEFSFFKREHIVSRKLIEKMFNGNDSKSVAAFPLRAIFLIESTIGPIDPIDPMSKSDTETQPVQILFSVSKRHFKHAVDRNRLKRQLREAYRLNRHLLFTHNTDKDEHSFSEQCARLYIAFIWLSNEHAPSTVIYARMNSLLKRIAEKTHKSLL